MPHLNQLVIRVQSRDGTRKIELAKDSSTADLFAEVRRVFALTDDTWQLFRDRQKQQRLISNGSLLSAVHINHGDLLYLDYAVANPDVDAVAVVNGELPAAVLNRAGIASPKLDEVDVVLLSQDGRIPRERNEKQCHHGALSKCVHCFPIDPWDEEYLHQKDIRHMSFHAYVRKITSGPGASSHAHPLENISCKVKEGCVGHPPYPAGICSKCQPSAVALNRQRYRHVDNIIFENNLLMSRFLDYWRKSGNQRIGFLLGRYELSSDVPLGIKAFVSAIYEPPQHCTANSVELLHDPHAELVESLCRELNLRKVGWIFTDLLSDAKGRLAYLRHADTYFLSGEECITAAHFQNLHPNPCQYASEGYFGSKFVTVIVTGDKQQQIHSEGYQVSNQGAALVKDECLVPTDAPELLYVKDSTAEQYVPDVLFKEKDEYGNEVSRLGRPLPVEYLIVDVPAGAPIEQQFTFFADAEVEPFPVENRMELENDGLQNLAVFNAYGGKFTEARSLQLFNDFHVLLYLLTNDGCAFTLADLRPVLRAIKNQNVAEVQAWMNTNEKWRTFARLVQEARPEANVRERRPREAATAELPVENVERNNQQDHEDDAEPPAGWHCAHCTFTNPADRHECEMCALPREN